MSLHECCSIYDAASAIGTTKSRAQTPRFQPNDVLDARWLGGHVTWLVAAYAVFLTSSIPG